jgi:outer membrane protein W
MKKLLFATAIMFAATATFAQDGGAAYSKGQNTVSLGYGFISPYKTLFKATNILGGAIPGLTSKFTSLGPVALTYENGIADKISVGVQVGYATLKNVDTEKDGLGAGKDFIETSKLTQLAVYLRGNYHFGESEKFDPYIGLGIGYNNFKYTIEDNDPSTGTITSLFKIPGSVGFSGQLGAKYYFSSSIGAYAELGYLAGSFAQIGLVAKF